MVGYALMLVLLETWAMAGARPGTDKDTIVAQY
jgi:hypothetical protein